ncbi:hypothetical protein G9A89_019001 [Geosiphon pyriformis]|nr:hypothetical protein G9A89_019001 [Geosiphon pyriformis]
MIGATPSVVCLFCGDVEFSDHVFVCSFDATGCAQLLDVYASFWEVQSGLSQSTLCVLHLLTSCFSDATISTTLCKDFVFNDWYCESFSVFKNAKVAALNIVCFVHEFCFIFHDEFWLVHAKHRAFIERNRLIPHDGFIPALVSGLPMMLLASVIRLLGVVEAFGIGFGFHKSCLFFSGIGDFVSVRISA